MLDDAYYPGKRGTLETLVRFIAFTLCKYMLGRLAQDRAFSCNINVPLTYWICLLCFVYFLLVDSLLARLPSTYLRLAYRRDHLSLRPSDRFDQWTVPCVLMSQSDR